MLARECVHTSILKPSSEIFANAPRTELKFHKHKQIEKPHYLFPVLTFYTINDDLPSFGGIRSSNGQDHERVCNARWKLRIKQNVGHVGKG